MSILPTSGGVRWLSILPIAIPAPCFAQDFAEVVRAGDQGIVRALGARPLEMAAAALGREFRLRVHVEDVLHRWSGDLDQGNLNRQGSPRAPKARFLEASFSIGQDSQPSDVPALLAALVERASIERPFGHRIDPDGDGYTLVPTQAWDANGALVPFTPPLDTVVSFPTTTRALWWHFDDIRAAIYAATGIRIALSIGANALVRPI